MTRPTVHGNARPASWQRKEEFSLAFTRAGIESDGGGGGGGGGGRDRAQFRVIHVHGRLSHTHSPPIPHSTVLSYRNAIRTREFANALRVYGTHTPTRSPGGNGPQ